MNRLDWEDIWDLCMMLWRSCRLCECLWKHIVLCFQWVTDREICHFIGTKWFVVLWLSFDRKWIKDLSIICGFRCGFSVNVRLYVNPENIEFLSEVNAWFYEFVRNYVLKIRIEYLMNYMDLPFEKVKFVYNDIWQRI